MSTEDWKKNTKIKGRIQNSVSGLFRAMIVGALVVAQFVIILAIPLLFSGYSSLSYVLMELFGLAAIVALTNDSRVTAYKFSWLCLILVLPISGIVMFNLWGKVGKNNKLNMVIQERFAKVDKNLEHDKEICEEFYKKHPVSSRISKYISSENLPLYKNNKLKYYSMGEDVLKEIYDDIVNAKKFILIEFFIVAEGGLWDELFEILKKKVKEGVEVKFILDDFGSMFRTGRDFVPKLEAEGIQVGVFNPIHKYASKLYMNFRDHEKIVVIDGNIGYTGGYNLADEYANIIERFGVWKDCGIRVEGDAVWGLTVTFMEMWSVCRQIDITDIDNYRPNKSNEENEAYCHVLRDGPALGTHSFLGNVYRQMMNLAGQKLYVMTPYLILEDYTSALLVQAKKRGVDVRIITPGIPDKKHVKWLTELYYGDLLKNGIRIYEYTPGFIHSKVIMKENCAIVGTINLDYRSFYLHYENGVWVYDKPTVDAIEADFNETFEVSREISYEEWKKRPLRRKIAQHFLKIFSTLC